MQKTYHVDFDSYFYYFTFSQCRISMKQLRICFLWHQHQPYYRKEEKFILPWVRFHAIKDYLDLPLILFEFPEIKQTFNIVPSLLLQIYEYTQIGVKDRVQELSYKLPSSLSLEEKQEILKQFFVCNYQNLIAKYPRYLELYNKANSNAQFTEQDWLDLQVWYNLAWLGPITRQRPQFKRYFTKEKGFSQKEKELLLEEELQIMNQIVPVLKQLSDLNQVELSVSPFYHPILPLLCDASIAKVGLPELHLQEPIFKFPQDAEIQMEKGKQYFKEVFGFEPKGIWPSEGSLSTTVLDLMLVHNFTWTATDPKLLFRSINLQDELLQYFPYVYEKNSKRLVLFFRDSILSDSIGFTYHHWKPEDAVFDFVNILKTIRNRIVQRFGEDALDIACVPIILDGENCWEYYTDNGLPFLTLLYRTISDEPLLKTYTFSEIVSSIASDHPYQISEIFPGSWINANFYTWIGQPQKQKAWHWLAKIRQLIEEHKSDSQRYFKAMEYMLIAEGSDWFWWYGDDNIAPNKSDFDELFRWYLINIYKALEKEPPSEILEPLSTQPNLALLTVATKRITRSTIRKLSTDVGWGRYYAKSAIGTMLSNKIFLSEIYFGNTRSLFLVGLRLLRELQPLDKITILILEPKELKVELGRGEFNFISDTSIDLQKLYFAYEEGFVVGVDLNSLWHSKDNFVGSRLEFLVKTENELGEVTFPIDGAFTYIVI